MSVRPARESDLDALADLIRALAVYERMPEAVTFAPAELRRHLFGPQRAAEALVAEGADGQVVGYTIFFPVFSTFRGAVGMHVEDIFVREEHRGQGWGRRLLAAVGRIARERGYQWLQWDVLDWNEPAIRFYRGLGARPLDEWTIYRLEGAAFATLAGEGEAAPPSAG